MKITWLGTAGFRIQTRTTEFLTDPYVSRNPRARPVQPLAPESISRDSIVFLSHGHFDHAADLPRIQPRNLFCSRTLGPHLIRHGLSPDSLGLVDRDGWEMDGAGIRAQAFFSHHIQFDLPLVAARLKGLLPEFFSWIRLFRAWPCGRVLSWRFFLEGKTLHFFGSGGSTRPELERLAREGPLDLLMVPLQGHSRIHEIALDYVRVLRPGAVMPHHFDDFFPPISRQEDLSAFIRGMEQEFPKTRLIIPRINQPIDL